MTTIAATDRLAVVKMLASGLELGLVVNANPHLSDDDVRRIAHDHGYPSVAKLKRAAEQIARNSDDPGVLPGPEPKVSPPSNKPQPIARGGLFDVALSDLQPSPANPRERMTDIAELAASMREVGLIQPIVAQQLDDGSLQILAGHRRHAAALMLGWTKVPCLIRKAMLPDTELVTMLIENGQRAGLDPIEEARALNHLKVTTGLSDLQLAKRVGRSQQLVSSRLALLGLPYEQQEAIRSGLMSLTEGVARGRVDSGRIRPGAVGRTSPAQLSTHHPLAPAAKARCLRLKHSRGRGTGVGGIACGECWESVIRADERHHQHDVSAANGSCALCGSPYRPSAT